MIDSGAGTSAERVKLDRSLVSGVAWTAMARFGSQIISWGSLLILARLLSPSDFGLIGMATIYLGFITMLSACGIDTTIIAMPDLTEAVIRQLNTTATIFGVASTLLAAGAAIPIALFFKAPQLRLAIPVMGLGFTVAGFAVVPQALLLKELRFKHVSLIEASQSAVQGISGVLLAWFGFGYWSLLLSGLIATTVASAIPVALRPCGFKTPRLREIRRELTFSRQVLMSRLAWYCYSNADFVVAGRVLGEAALGVYTMAWNIASIPAEKITVLIARVTPSIFSRVQDHPTELRRYIRVLTEALALMTFPVGFGIALVSRPFVMAALDKRWWGASVPLALLAVYMAMRCIATLLPQILNVLQDAGFVMWQSLGALAVLPPVFYFASRWGAAGIAGAWSVVFPIVTLPLFPRVFSRTGMRLADYWKAIKPAGLASCIMTAAVLGVHYALPELPSLLVLVIEAGTGAVAYIAVLLIRYPERVEVFRRVVLRKQAADV